MDSLLPPRSRLAASPLAGVWLLGLTQITGYGTLYYSFPILAGSIAADFGWKTSSVFGLFSLALLAGGLTAPLAGRLMDKLGAAHMMVWGSAGSAASLVLLTLLDGPAFLLGLIALEITSGLALYDAAFATLAQRNGGEARHRITQMTLVAGFASSLFWPITEALHQYFSWREVMWIYAAANLLICMPVHALLHRNPPHIPADEASSPPPQSPEAPAHLYRPLLLLVSIGFALAGFVLSGTLTMMVPLLTAIGLGAAAVPVSTLFGPAQVFSRLINMGLGKRIHPLTGTIVASALMGGATWLLAASAPLMAGAILFAIMFGLGSGLNSIVRGTLPLVLFGAATYGTVLGQMAFARLVLNAAAPFAFAWLMDHAGPQAALTAMGFVGLAAIVCFVAAGQMLRR